MNNFPFHAFDEQASDGGLLHIGKPSDNFIAMPSQFIDPNARYGSTLGLKLTKRPLSGIPEIDEIFDEKPWETEIVFKKFDSEFRNFATFLEEIILNSLLYPSEDMQTYFKDDRDQIIELATGALRTTAFASPYVDELRGDEAIARTKRELISNAEAKVFMKFGVLRP